MKRLISVLATSIIALASGTALGAPTSTPPTSGTISPPVVPSQPNQDCESLGNQPGNTTANDGSAFSPTGQSGKVYAGEQTNRNDKNIVSVSQYDVACEKNQSPQH